ncbi:MAG: putative nucleotidyltransferase substrate binding domain-containing protein [Gammaproteobacteria bacterium]
MSSFLDLREPPFAGLAASERQRIRDNIDVARFDTGDVVKKAGKRWKHLYIVLRGSVDALDEGGNRVTQFGVDDLVGARDLLRGDKSRQIVAERPTVCLSIPREIIDWLCHQNTAFRLALGAEGQARPEVQTRSDEDSFTLARVKDAEIRKAVVMDAATLAREGIQALRERKADCLLVQRGEDYGMVTGTNLLVAAGSDAGIDTPLGDVASWELLTISRDEYLFDALVVMTRQQVERLVVMDKGELVGILELNDVLGLFSTQSHSLGIRIQRAETIEELESASAATIDLTRSLVDRGVTVSRVVDLLSALNGRTMSQVFRMCVPEPVWKQACLIVMGSEGRGEQIIKTDQDNAIVMADDVDWPDRQRDLERFSELLSRLGYPPCPGNYMVSNPDWVMTVSEWQQRIEKWIRRAGGDDMLDLTVFSDARPVTGNTALFQEVKSWMLERFHGNVGFISTFAHPVIRFSVPLDLFGRIKKPDEGIDIKKGAVFPLVHGVRSLALDNRLRATNTFRRIRQLVSRRALDPATGEDLAGALETFMLIRLRQQLEAMASGLQPDNVIRPAGLPRMERDQLRRGLRIVKAFQTTVTRRYHLEL